MADARALEALKAGGSVWGRYRADFLRIQPRELINLTDADLAGLNLENVDLSGTNFSGTNFYRAFMSRANLTGSDLTGTNFYRAYLRGATLHRADLSGANFTSAELNFADLTWANLFAANLYDADLTDADLTDANVTDVVMSVLTRNTRSRTAADFLLEEPESAAVFDVQPADVPQRGTVRIAIPELPGGMPAGELARLSDAIAVIAELSQRVGTRLGQRMRREEDRGGGTSVLTATAGDEFGPIVVRRIQYGSPWLQELWDAAGPYLAGGGAGVAATTAAVVAKRARDGAEDVGRVWSLMLTLARRSERDEYFAARDARAEAKTAEELSRKARAEADTAEHESRRDKARATSNSAPEVAEPEVDILRLAATRTRAELEQRLHQSELSTFASEAELNRIAGILAPFLEYPVEVSRQSEPA